MAVVAAIEERAFTPTLRPRVQVTADEWLEYDLYYITEPWQVPHVVAWMRRQKLYLLDIETDGMTPDGLDWQSKKIATIQIGSPVAEGGPVAFVLCLRSLGSSIKPVIEALNDPTPMKLGQNIGFECRFMMHKWRKLKLRNLADTQLMELICRAGLFPISKSQSEDGNPDRKAYGETSMQRLGYLHLGIEIEKCEDIRRTFWSTPAKALTDRHLVYGAGDVLYPWYIARSQHKEIKSRRLSDIVKIEFELLPILAWSEINGICIDVAEWKQLWQEAVVRQGVAKAQLDEIFRPQSQQSELFGEVTRGRKWRKVSLKDVETFADEHLERKQELVRPNDGKYELNYDSPGQVKEAFRTYCRRLNWPVELVTTMPRLKALKASWGKDWLAKRPGKTIDDVPQYLIPENRYCILIKFEGDGLRLAKLRGQLPKDLVNVYLEYKEAAKLAGTYGMKFLNKWVKDGVVHVYFHQAITSTGRLSSEPNTMNWPRIARYRACLTPHKGRKFVIRDYSAIEPRLSAETSQDPNYLRIFLEGLDIYCGVGEIMTGNPIDKKKDPALRQGFKSIVLGTAYNMGARKLRDDLTLKLEDFIERGEVPLPTFELARDLRERFFETHPGIKRYQDQCIAYATPREEDVPRSPETGLPLARRPKIWDAYLAAKYPGNPEKAVVTYVEAPCGRKRWFDSEANNTYTEAPNAPIQSCSATITKLAVCLIQRYADEHGIEIAFANYVHDELVVEVAAEIADSFSLVVKDLMEEAGRRYIKTVPVLAEAPEGNGVFDFWFKEG